MITSAQEISAIVDEPTVNHDDLYENDDGECIMNWCNLFLKDIDMLRKDSRLELDDGSLYAYLAFDSSDRQKGCCSFS
jgi:hypothetical protein